VHNGPCPGIYPGQITEDQALNGASEWLGEGYQEMGKPGSGVFRSSDGARQFRMVEGDLAGTNGPPGLGPHVHFEELNPSGRVIFNEHYRLTP
jgi:filamentous hemagglutinin